MAGRCSTCSQVRVVSDCLLASGIEYIVHLFYFLCFQEVRGSTQVRPIDEASMSGRSFEFHVYTGDVW